MSYTPVEIRHVKLRRGLFGYRRHSVDTLLDEITQSFETVWRERADQSDRVELLEGELKRYRELEALLRTTLVSAERAAHELKDQAKKVAGQVEGYASEAMDKLRETGAGEVAGNIKGAVDKSVKDQPMATLALAAVVGFVLGAIWKA